MLPRAAMHSLPVGMHTTTMGCTGVVKVTSNLQATGMDRWAASFTSNLLVANVANMSCDSCQPTSISSRCPCDVTALGWISPLTFAPPEAYAQPYAQLRSMDATLYSSQPDPLTAG